jgi:hemolysin activation/secretion protein
LFGVRVLLRLLWPLAALVVAFAGVAAPRPAYAERPPEPGAIERTIPTETRHNSNAPALVLPARKLGAQSAGKKFTLGAVNIDGATVFSQQELSSSFEDYLATEVDQAKLAQMAQAITARYRQTGYLLSYAMVPSQNVHAGMVRLAVVEGRIDKVSVQGAGSAQAAIEAIAAPLLNGGPLRGGSLERTIGLIRDFPGVTVGDIALMRSDVEGGRYTLKINVIADRFRAFTYADNRGTGSIGHSRVYNSFSLSSLAIQGDELRVDLFAMPGGHSRYLYGQASAATPVGHNGMRFQFSASRGDQYLRADERFEGQSDNVSAQLSYPFLRSRALTLIGKTSFTDWRSIGARAGARHLRDRLRVALAGLEIAN